MWLIAQIGFFSSVQKPDDVQAGMLTIRARVRSDLESLRDKYLPSMGPIIVNGGTDYRYRAKGSRSDVVKAIASLVEDIAYRNFKSALARSQGKSRATTYHHVWSALSRLQDNREAPPPAHAALSIPKASSYGGVLIDRESRVLLREPTNHFGGYYWTFAKGKPDKGESAEQAALREVREETGYEARIVGALPKAHAGTTGTTAFFLMRPIGDQGRYHHETSATQWVTFSAARKMVAMNKGSGDRRDREVLDDAEALLKTLR